ncbi:hypothetical protein Tco_1345173, partial [Tanacetum coccineum]
LILLVTLYAGLTDGLLTHLYRLRRYELQRCVLFGAVKLATHWCNDPMPDSTYKHPSTEREENLAPTKARGRYTTLYVEAAGGAKSKNLCSVGSKGVDHVINSGNKRNEISKLYEEGWEKDPNKSHFEADAREVDDRYSPT